jgi:hypothetical protein
MQALQQRGFAPTVNGSFPSQGPYTPNYPVTYQQPPFQPTSGGGSGGGGSGGGGGGGGRMYAPSGGGVRQPTSGAGPAPTRSYQFFHTAVSSVAIIGSDMNCCRSSHP